tara:strand:- start:1190 stop:2269 length:1080 start_codon:yes stop_codon:yes gene_type:complete
MKLLVEAPLNRLSLGNVSYNFIRELFKREVEIGIFPTGDTDLSAYKHSPEFQSYLETAINNRLDFLKADIPSLKVWHINGSENRKNKDQYLYSFYECNQPTVEEIKICGAQDKVFFSSSYATKHFKSSGLTNVEHIPLGLDEDFKVTGKSYLKDVIHFGLMGKWEKRKHTQKIIQTWLKKYGNNPKYLLTCCVTNPFFKPEEMQSMVNATLGGQNYSNINFLPPLATNAEVNELLNSIDIDLTGLSGGEGWNLPSFNSTCLGKWSVVLNVTSHKDWATKDNSILVESSGQIDAADGVFFQKNKPFNQGTFYTWEEEAAIEAMEKAEAKAGQINTEGQKLSDKFTYSNTVDSILNCIYRS